MMEAIWHLVYMAAFAGIVIVTWEKRSAIAAWWKTTAAQRAATAENIKKRLGIIKDEGDGP